jgi:glutamine amidotransferase
VRAATGTPVQETNCHPFRHGRWLFVHNGYVTDFARIRRELLWAVRPDLFNGMLGSTDSELLFHLALTFGLDDDPVGALERMAGFVEAVGAANGIAEPLQMTIGLTDGRLLRAVRYASGPVVNSLHVSEDIAAVQALYPENERLQHFSDGARVVVSEPLVELPGLWREVRPATTVIIGDRLEEQAFRPQPPG